MTARARRWSEAALLAALAYLPALFSSPGRMPADSKLYLYLDPGRFMADAAGTFDPRQFAGWVPHQHIAYLWPSGPWFWMFDAVGVPDWIAHRLWIGTVFVLAGLGARACARQVGLDPTAAVVAGVVYQMSLFTLPYVSRTSVMLLPWAGLGWIVAFTARAAVDRGWRWPAATALVVFTVGAVNATALVLIVPGPVLWLVHEASRRSITWRRAAATALRTAVLSIGVSLWWVVASVVQRRHGPDVLAFSETLRDVSFTSTAPEVWRGLGYWLFYIRDPFGPTTSEALRYLSSTQAIVVSFTLSLVGLAGLVWSSWAHRRFAVLLVAVGFVLAVGVHPFDDRPPLMRLLVGSGDDGLALALRSSTRALPVMMLGLALGAGALVAALANARRSIVTRAPHALAPIAIVALAVVNVPAVWSGGFVDPLLVRDADVPPAWRAAATSLDERLGDGSRVLQLPGAEFGAFRWGYTVDQPLPALVDAPVVTRDLLPLGSPPAMDLLLALDDRLQDGVLEPESIAPIARLLGVGTVWLSHDHATDRFRTARPGWVSSLIADAPGLGVAEAFGPPGLPGPSVPHIDERSLGDPNVGRPMSPVELTDVLGAPTIVRAARSAVAVSGNGDGLVDAAAAGLLPEGVAVRYTASGDSLDDAVALVVTDSNRSQARHWRSSQDTRGATEHADATFAPAMELDVLRPTSGDARLDVFDDAAVPPVAATTAWQDGPVRATATSYGEPFAYLPEHRASMAIDGDPSTAWLVGEHADPIGEALVLITAGIERFAVRLPDPAGGRRITRLGLEIETTEGVPRVLDPIDLDARVFSEAGQPIELGDVAGTVTLTIAAVDGGTPGTAGAVGAVGISEIAHDLGRTAEFVRPPHDGLRAIDPDTPLAVVLTRWRVDPMDRWRDDPEPVLRRVIDLRSGRTVTPEVTVRVDARSSDAELAELFGWPVTASTRLTGSLRNAGIGAFDGDPSTAWITAFDGAVGARLRVRDVDAPIDELRVRQPVGGFSRVTELTLRAGDDERRLDVMPDASGATVLRFDELVPSGELEIEVSGVSSVTAIDRRFGDIVELPAAISSIEFEGAPLVDAIDATDLETPCVPIARVADQPVSVSIRVAGDAWADDRPVATTVCSGDIDLTPGEHLITATDGPVALQLDRLVLDDGARAAIGGATSAAQAELVRADVVERTRFARTIDVAGCVEGCWLVVGEGFNDAWSASVSGIDLGPPSLIDGGFNGWWLSPSPGPITVDVRWTAQWPLTWALIATAGMVVLSLGLVARGLVRRSDNAEPADSALVGDVRWCWAGAPTGRSERRPIAFRVGAWGLLAGFLIDPWWSVVGLLVGATVALWRRQRVAELVSVATVATVAAAVVWLERRDAPIPDGAWPARFESLHRIAVFAAVALAVAALDADDVERPAEPSPAGSGQPASDAPADAPAGIDTSPAGHEQHRFDDDAD